MPFKPIKAWIEKKKQPEAARIEMERDAQPPPSTDPGIDLVVRQGLAWLQRAQEQSTSSDGGVSPDWSLIYGWNTSYPESTGDIVPTMIEGSHSYIYASLRLSAKRVLAIQLPDGGFQGGRIDSTPVVSVTATDRVAGLLPTPRAPDARGHHHLCDA